MTIADKPIILLVGIIIVLSCSKTPAKWTKDYYDYQIGAFINGKEFHEAYGITLSQHGMDFGFQMENFSIEGKSMAWVSWQGFNRELYSDPKRKGPSYSFYFVLVYDLELNNASCIEFVGLAGEVGLDYIYSPDYHGTPLVKGYLGINNTYENNHCYWIKEGTIALGDFLLKNNGYDVNSDMVTFSFIAENDSGERLVLEDGYCKAYSNRGVYE